MRTLIVGLSTRAIAESAVRGDHPVVTLDYFGDRDQRALVENYALKRDYDLPFSAAGLLQASRNLDFEAVAYISNLENHPQVVEELARGHVLWGNTPAVLRRARDWRTLRALCHQEEIPCPTTLLAGEEGGSGFSGRSVGLSEPIRWLRKPIRSGGGHGIRPWSGELLDEEHLLQANIVGLPASAAFVADGRNCVLLGLTEQLIGRSELGARRFSWCGNILPLDAPALEMQTILGSVRATVEEVTRAYGLRGLNGVDLMLGRDEAGQPVPYLLEVNPRYTASMELVERAYGLNMFDLHLRSFRGDLPSFSLEEELDRGGHWGKAIIYAKQDVVMPETAEWKARGRRDIPFPGEQIEEGHPICTVLAQGSNRVGCWRNLLAAADAVYKETMAHHGGCGNEPGGA